MTVKEKTANNWMRDVDPRGIWMRLTVENGEVKKVTCALCIKFEEEMRERRNFSAAFINGISGSAIKKDNIVKHKDSVQHQDATMRSHGSCKRQALYTTPIG